jgi:NAD+-dependent farnesol dehydrogenase
MNRYFITGATGLIGSVLTGKLSETGCSLNLLVRSPGKAASLVTDGVTLFKGDVTDFQAVEKAMEGCTHVIHMAAYAKSYSEDPEIFDRTNVEGTRNVLEAALKQNIRRVVYTSTAGVFEITGPDNDANETSFQPDIFYTDYIRTKRAADRLCREYATKGLDIITTYPSRVFGPGVVSDSNGLTKIMDLYRKGKWRIIPDNGQTFGNYVYVGDVASGLIKAMETGKPGESYILGGENLSFNDLFKIIKEVTRKEYTLFHLPYPILWLASSIMVIIARLFHKKALISPGWVRRYLQHRRLSSQKAVEELNYEITPVREGLKNTLEWLNNKN